MRDIIWTIIILWIVWKIYDAFTSFTKPRPRQASFNGQYNTQQQYQYQQQQQQKGREGSVNVENTAPPKKTHFKPDDGEYVDYEDVK